MEAILSTRLVERCVARSREALVGSGQIDAERLESRTFEHDQRAQTTSGTEVRHNFVLIDHRACEGGSRHRDWVSRGG